MMKMMIAAIGAAMVAGSALAADLPKKQARLDQQLTVAVANDSHWYVSANGGFNYLDGVSIDDSQKSLGAVIGYRYNPNIAAELAFTQFFEQDGIADDGQALVVNGIASLPTGTVFTPYLLAGVGAGFNGLGHGDDPQAIYNLGGGLRYSVNESVDLDVRYTHVDAWESSIDNDSVTAGISFKF